MGQGCIGTIRASKVGIYRTMEKKNHKLIDKVISGLDWDSILEVNKCFKIGVGEGTNAIPGLKRKIFSDDLTKSDLKAELKSLLKHVLDNNLPELYYGPWMIYWMDAEWVFEAQDQDGEDDDDQDGMEINITLEIDSNLEVIYSPQRILVLDPVEKEGIRAEKTGSEVDQLEAMLKKALESEKYELASKIKDLIGLQKGDSSEDK